MHIIPQARDGRSNPPHFRQLWGPLPWAWQPSRESRLRFAPFRYSINRYREDG